MSDILELRHVEVLRQRNCLIPRKPTHTILMAARGLMMVELQSCGQDVIYKSLADRPWQAIVAGMADNIRSDFVGPGIKEFRLQMRRKERCPYTRDPMAIFVAVREDGRKAIHHPHATKDEPLRFEDEDGVKSPHPPTKDEIVRAFRLATNWSVQNRWTAFQTGVFQGILRRFKRHFRPEGFCLTDFQLGTRVQAWELAPSVKVKFLEFLQNGCQGQNDLTNSEGESDADADNSLLANTLHLHQTGTTQEWQIDLRFNTKLAMVLTIQHVVGTEIPHGGADGSLHHGTPLGDPNGHMGQAHGRGLNSGMLVPGNLGNLMIGILRRMLT